VISETKAIVNDDQVAGQSARRNGDLSSNQISSPPFCEHI